LLQCSSNCNCNCGRRRKNLDGLTKIGLTIAQPDEFRINALGHGLDGVAGGGPNGADLVGDPISERNAQRRVRFARQFWVTLQLHADESADATEIASAGGDAEGVPNVGLTVPVCNLLAYLLGPITLTQPHWVAVGLTVTAVLLLTGRERLHTMARQLELPEIVTAGKFLILTGIILPLLPNEPITPLTRVTPYQAWLALVAVCTLSYGSYLLQRYWTSNRSAFVTAILGSLFVNSDHRGAGTPCQHR
jgi:hypothetical protein